MPDPVDLPESGEFSEFKPCLMYYRELDLLQWIQEDVPYVATPLSETHAADVLYRHDRSKVIGVQIWGALAAIKKALEEDASAPSAQEKQTP